MLKGHIEITEILEIDIPEDVEDPNLYVDVKTREYLAEHDIDLGSVDINSYTYEEQDE